LDSLAGSAAPPSRATYGATKLRELGRTQPSSDGLDKP
jgi:hypothetical protein